MRLIDADALKRDICKYCNDVYSDEPCEPSDCEHMRIIDNQPTIDAVEVVRCKDCKYYRTGEYFDDIQFCFRLRHPTEDKQIGYNFSDDDFCSRGERKTDDREL